MIKLAKTKPFWLLAGVFLILAAALLALVLSFGSGQPAQTTTRVELAEQTDLPAGSRLVIQLRESGVDGPLIAEQTVTNPDPTAQSFEIDHNPADLKDDKDYYFRVEVYDANNQLLFLGNSPYTPNSPAQVKTVEQVVETPQSPIEEPAEQTTTEPPGQPRTQPPTTEPPAPDQTTTEPPANQATATVNIHFDQNYNLPAGAQLNVRLQNLGSLQNSSNKTIAQAEVTDPGPPPLAVGLAYDPAQAPSGSRYLILASIDGPDGKLLMTNNTFGFEVKIGQINNIDVHLVAVRPDREKTPEELDAAITGNINYQKSCQLPAGSKLTIKLLDASLADAVSPIIAETEIIDPGSSPVKFELKYDSNDINSRNSYSLSGRIDGPDGQLLFINDTIYEVITRGHPTKLNLPLVKVKGC